MQRDNRFQLSLVGGAALLAMVTLSLVAAAKLSKTGSAEGGFHSKGPAGLSIDGKTAEVDVADDGATVTVTIKLTNIDTGMSIRNEHTPRRISRSASTPPRRSRSRAAPSRWAAARAIPRGR